MTVFNSLLLLFVSVFFKTYLTSTALVGESIITQNVAYAEQFTYQAAFMGKKNNSHKWILQGSGAIISSKHILGAAQTFIDEKGNHKEFNFSVVVDEVNLKNEFLIYRDIIRFFLPGPGDYKINDISISEIREEVDIDNNPKLSKLEIPNRRLGNLPRHGIVSGYGFNWVEIKYVENEYGYIYKPVIDKGDTDKQLRFEEVTRMPDRNCIIYEKLDTTMYFCGEMPSSVSNSTGSDSDDNNDYPDSRKKIRGLCILDNGNPLVVKYMYTEYVIGVASTHNEYCNDESSGGLYSSVVDNFEFIEGVLNSHLLYGTLVYRNRPHEMNNNLPGSSTST